MAKLDDFGRPIYETAEEYNKAHRASGTVHTYESQDGDTYQHKTMESTPRYRSVAQRHATVQGSKNAKKIVMMVVVFIIAVNIGIIFSIFHSVGISFGDIEIEYEENLVETEEVNMDTVYDEYLSDGDTPLPEGYEMFSYDGESYRIPTNYWKISQMGFTSDIYMEDELIPSGYEELLAMFDEDGYMRAEIRIKNNTENEIPLEECIVDYIYIENPEFYDEMVTIPDFEFGDGLTFDSSYEEVESYFGTPWWHHEEYSEEYDYDYHIYQWIYYPEEANPLEEQEDIQFVEVKFMNGVIESVSIEKRAYEEK